MLLSALAVVLCVALYVKIWFQKNFSYWTKYKVPSAKGSMFNGNFMEIITFKTNFVYNLKSIYDDPKFENEAAVGIYGLYKPGLLIRDTELLKAVFIKDFDKFCDRTAICDAHHDPIGSLNLFFAPHSYWKDMRSKISPVFSSAKIKHMYPLLQAVGNDLEEHLNAKGDKFTEDMKHLYGRFTTDAISTTLLGFQSHALKDAKEPIYLEAVKLAKFNLNRAMSFMFFYFIPQFVSTFRRKVFYESTYKFMRSTLDQVISNRKRSNQTHNDLIDIFVKLKLQMAAKDEIQSMDGIVAQGCIFMAGGFETSSTVIATTLFELAKQPTILTRLRREILDDFLEGNGQISYERMNSMVYLKMVIDETLRLYPVLPLLDRKFVASDKNMSYSLRPHYEYDVPDGMPIYISVYALHYDPKHWPNPKIYNPERFSPENRPNINPMAYLPFGSGPHNCIGSRLGLLQVKTGLVHIFKNHFVQICDQTVLEPELEPKAFVLQTKGEIRLEIVRDDMYKNAINKK